MTIRLSIIILLSMLLWGCMIQESTMYGIPKSVWYKLTPQEQQNVINAQSR